MTDQSSSIRTPLELLTDPRGPYPDRTRPLVTHYSGPGSRVELSVATAANAVAKAAGLLRDGLGLAPGEAVVSVDLPRHWQLPVWIWAALTVGAEVGADLPGHVDVRVIGPSGLAALAIPAADGDPAAGPADPAAADSVLACACDPFGGPVPAGLLAAVASRSFDLTDVGVEVRAYPDAFTPEPTAGPAARVRAVPDGAGTVAVPWPEAGAALAERIGPAARVWVDGTTRASDLLAVVALAPLLVGGSVVLADGLSESETERLRTVERAARLPAGSS